MCGMTFRPTTLERAYQLADSGECRTVTDVKKRLQVEGYERIADQLYGRMVTSALRDRCTAAVARLESAGPE
jgi:hypothetical protein